MFSEGTRNLVCGVNSDLSPYNLQLPSFASRLARDCCNLIIECLVTILLSSSLGSGQWFIWSRNCCDVTRNFIITITKTFCLVRGCMMQFVTTYTVKMTVIWDIAPCSPDDGGSKHL
jgi:hypothetical protein